MAVIASAIYTRFPEIIAYGIVSRAAGALLSDRAVEFMYPSSKKSASAAVTPAGPQHAATLRKAHSGKKMQPVAPPRQRPGGPPPPPPSSRGGRR